METNKIYQGNAKEVLKTLPEKSINTCITSPPYWGLRDYGDGNEEIWGGDENCNHQWVKEITRKRTEGDKPSPNSKIAKHRPNDTVNRPDMISSFCQKCGAWKGQLGLEPTPELFVKNLVSVCREIKRVLKDDGTFWLNLGDTYNNSPVGHKTVKSLKDSSTANVGNNHESNLKASKTRSVIKDGVLKQKDLVGIAWRVAFALQEDGWYLRNDIIWHKPNAMPESVKDRCTTSHEHIFLLTKSPKYYYDNEAIKEPVSESTKKRYEYGWNGNEDRDYTKGKQNNFSKYVGTEQSRKDAMKGRNKRDVWTVTTKPFPDAHFAVYPVELIKPCVRAGCPDNGIVLDPFMGAGTTALVALQEGKNFVGVELNKEFIDMAYKRLSTLDNKYYDELPKEKRPSRKSLI